MARCDARDRLSLESYLRAAPKVELHVHLEGSIRPATLLALAKRNGVHLPAESEAGLRAWLTYRSFPHFVEIYNAITRCLRTKEDYELITYEFGAEMARQHVCYAEVTFTPSSHYLRFGVPQEVYFDGLTAGRRRAYQDFGVEIAWIFDLVHVISDDELNRQIGEYTTGVAIEGREDGVVALGLAGIEIGHSFERVAPWFEQGRAAGLHSVPHAGETVGPASIWGAVQSLGAERIGHGVRAVEDPVLVTYLADRGIPIEVCPTSNVRLGVYRDLTAHPLRQLYDAGVIITINSDDPALFDTTLTDEVRLLSDPFGLSVPEIDEVLLSGVRHSFLPEDRKRDLERSFRSEFAALSASHLCAD